MTTHALSSTSLSTRLYCQLPYLLVLGLSLLLVGCGFQLRGSGQQFMIPFKTVHLAIPENSPLTIELSRNILGQGQIVSERKAAQATIEILSESRDKSILSLNSQGRVREFNLSYTVRFRVTDNESRELMPANEISLRRNINFNESQVLAKEAEETLLYKDMQSDLIQQLLRRIATIKSKSAG
jgi:LPS-assembly lipoprotein